MVGDRQKAFEELLQECGAATAGFIPPKPTVSDLQEGRLYDGAFAIYKQLGGVLDELPCRIGKYDFTVNDKIVELDEENHFNRYRAVTLSSPIYKTHKGVNVINYRAYCKTNENKCAKYGGFWSNASCAKQFGKPNIEGELSGNGAPRWKQRAFYDFIKDMVPTLYGIPLIRVSIYDEFKGKSGKSHTVDDILTRRDLEMVKVIYRQLIA